MDQGRFDSLARTLATGKTRRGLLGSLAALGAGLLGARAAGAQVTQAQCGNVLCAGNPGVCRPGCVCCVYPNGNSRCRPPQDCTAPGTVVSPPTTTTTTTTAAPTTTTTTTTTTAPPDPCASVPCATGQVCASGACQCANDDGFQCTIQCEGSVFPTTEGCLLCAASEDYPNCSENPETLSPPCASSADCGPGGFCVPIPPGSCTALPAATGLCATHCPAPA